MDAESAGHVPVMLDESLELLAVERGGVFVDCTLGLGGHAEAVLRASPDATLVGIDRDEQALRRARERLEPFGERVLFVHASFSELSSRLREHGIERVDGILADLGVSSMQLDRPERGFSFRFDGPLDMRMDRSRGRSARDVVNESSEVELVRILREYGEERRARRIAREIVDTRGETPFESTQQLTDAVHRALGTDRIPARRHRRPGGIDSATRTFQALRMEVNQELQELEALVDQAIGMLDQEGRLVVISYHSLEDRVVKCSFRDASVGEVDPVTGRPRAETRLVELLTKKPLRASAEEVDRNPRSRSARLRAARRL